MSRAKKILIVLGIAVGVILIVAIAVFFGITGQNTKLEHKTYNQDASGKKLAIITDNTEYKSQLYEACAQKADSGCLVEVYGLEDAAKVDANDYDLVAVVAPVYIGRLQSNAKRYIEKNSSSENLMLIVTSEGINDLDLDVDAVTTATSSQFSDEPEAPILSVDEVSDMIVERLG